MSFADLLLRRIEDEQRDLAVMALTGPAGRDAFEYGRVHGLYGGLERARDLLLAALRDENAKDI